MQEENQKEELSKKEKLFCSFYASTGNAYEAAIKAGYPQGSAGQTAQRLICDEIVAAYISEIMENRKKNAKASAICGYERLAFGSVADAVKLIFSEDPGQLDLDKFNLFNIAEIKRPKDGSMEIKFFDRLKALEKLESLCTDCDEKDKPFIRALEESAIAINKAFKDDEL